LPGIPERTVRSDFAVVRVSVRADGVPFFDDYIFERTHYRFRRNADYRAV